MKGFTISAFAVTLSVLVSASPRALPATISPGDLIVADYNGSQVGGGRIIQINATTGAQTLISSGGNLDIPWDVAIDASGYIIVADQPAGGNPAQVLRINPADGTQSVISSGSFLTTPTGIIVDASGDILVSDRLATNQGGILRINPATGAQTVVSQGGSFNGAAGLASDTAGALYVNTTPSGGTGLEVLKVDPNTGAQQIMSSSTRNSWYSGIVVAADGEIFSSEIYYNNGILDIDPLTGTQTFIAQGYPMQDPWGLDMDALGNIYVADGNVNSPGKIILVDSTTGSQTILSSGGLLVDPAGIAIYPVPEPSTIVMLSAGGIFVLGYLWRRRRQSGVCTSVGLDDEPESYFQE